MRSDRLAPSGRPARGGARPEGGGAPNRPWGVRKADSAGARPPLPPDTPRLLEGSGAAPAPWAEAPTVNQSLEKRGNGGNGVETPGNHGGNARPPGRNGRGNGEGAPRLRPGLPPRVRPAPPHNPSRARIGPSAGSRASHPAPQAPRSPLPRAADSLPRAVRPVETPLPWPQGHIPATCYFPAPPRPHRYRTTDRRSGEPVTAGRVVGVMRGCPINPQILGPPPLSAPISPASSAIATC